MATFPTLNNNIFYGALYNGFRYMNTVADNLSALDDSLVSKYKINGDEYQDQLVYTDCDIIHTYVWDPNDTNVLAPGDKVIPVQQAIPIDQKRQCNLFVDNGYLSKRVWMGSGAWEGFRSVVVSQLSNTTKLFDQKMVYTAIGNMNADMPSGKGSKQAQTITFVSLPETPTLNDYEAKEKSDVRKIGKKIADVFVELKDANRDYNDYGFMKAFDQGSCTIIWNKDYVNKFEYIDLPLLYGNAGKTQSFEGVQLPGYYFGRAITNSDKGSGKIIDANNLYDATKGDLRTLVEKEFTFAGELVHLFPGDKLTTGMQIDGSGHPDFTASELYIVDDKVICKIVHNDAIVYPTSWKTSTEFFNAKNLSTNMYETWYYGKPAHRKSYPLITIKEA